MTVLLAFLCFPLFVIWCFTASFKTSLKRWLTVIGIGVLIDITIAMTSLYLANGIYF